MMLIDCVKKSWYFLFIILISFCSCSTETGKFVKLSQDKTGIGFANIITENDSLNIFDFGNIYNGGGLGVGDFNNDGLQDLYFTGNMVSNKLYLNQGKLKFEDITTASQTEGKGVWSRGVAIVDINNDGKMDIYVCATAARNPLERINILYVNQGVDNNNVPVFKDMAAEYGLADTTQSTMAYFFDYDNDEDLDLYIAVNHIIKDEYTNLFRKRNLNGEHPSTGKIYRNDWSDSLQHPVFTDVSVQAGILIEGYSHAADIFDANNDGWLDILVLNDFVSNNVLYINNKDGTFTDRVEEYFKHAAANSMGSDAVDINNDGLDDVIEVDMSPEDNYRKKMFQNANSYLNYQNSDLYGYQYQYVRNMLHINQGQTIGEQDSLQHPIFADVGFFAGIAETDWSWTPLAADFDNDGYKDIFFSNGYPRDITDHDFIAFRKMASSLVTKKEMLEEIPTVKIHNYIFRNLGDIRFRDKTIDWGIEDPTFANGAVYADLDNDGDLDIVINNIKDPASVYENRIIVDKKIKFIDLKFSGPSKNINGIGARVIVHQKGAIQAFTNNPYRGYISSVSPVVHFGLGNIEVDSIEIIWPGSLREVIRNVPLNNTITVDIKNAGKFQLPSKAVKADANWFTNITGESAAQFVHQQRDFIDFNIQRLLPHKFTEYTPGIAVGDINGDGLDDFVVGGSPGFSPAIFKQSKNNTFTSETLIKDAAAKKPDDRGLLLFDADNDNDLDLYISAGGYAYEAGDKGYQDIFFVNDGKGNFAADTTAFPVNTTSKLCVRACDYDKDGDLDLFVSGRVKPWNYPQAVSSFIYRNDTKDGAIKFTDVTSSVAPSLVDLGLTCDALWTDFNNDGWIDLIVAGEWISLTFLQNEKGILKNVTKEAGMDNTAGWWNSIAGGDFDNDGDIDYIAGNLGENSYYKASDQFPVRIYAKDFDKNGVLECIPTKYILSKQGGTLQEFPAHTRDDVVEPMPFIKKKYLTYASFANSTFHQIFTQDELKDAIQLKADHLKSSFIRNNGNGTFSIEQLPDVAQYSVIDGMVADDFDGDGNLDICINTNDYGTEPGNGRYDALNGLILRGDGNGKFKALSIVESGIFIKGNGKALVKLVGGNDQYLLVASQNKGPLQVYRNKKRVKITRMLPGDLYATFNFKNGKKQKTEFYYGSSFLSQSGNFLVVPADAISGTIRDSKGKERPINEVNKN